MSQLAADLREMITEQVKYRELLFQMTRRDLLLRYKQTVMGFGWAIFMPLVNTILFSVVFTRVAPIDTGMPYPLFAYCGLLVWNFSAASWRFAITSLTTNTSLVTKVYFPREIFPISAVLVALVDFATGALLLAGLMWYYGFPVTPAVIALPAIVLVQVLLTAGVALLISMANLFYRDVKYIFELFLTVWMFMSSVLYPVTLVDGRAGELLRWNPMTLIVDAYRDVLLRGTYPPAGPFAAAAALSVVIFGAGWILFHRAEFQFAESV
jgi:ABC-type polysaccharide/polyol phosphate export permease